MIYLHCDLFLSYEEEIIYGLGVTYKVIDHERLSSPTLEIESSIQKY